MTTAKLKYTQLGQSDSLGSVFHSAVNLVFLWQARASQRRQLAGLSAEQLRDIDISRAAALEEAAKPFWCE